MGHHNSIYRQRGFDFATSTTAGQMQNVVQDHRVPTTPGDRFTKHLARAVNNGRYYDKYKDGPAF